MAYSCYKFLFSKVQKDGTKKVWGVYQIYDMSSLKTRFINNWHDKVIKNIIFIGNIEKNSFNIRTTDKDRRLVEYSRRFKKRNYVKEIFTSGPNPNNIDYVKQHYPNLHTAVDSFAIYQMLRD